MGRQEVNKGIKPSRWIDPGEFIFFCFAEALAELGKESIVVTDCVLGQVLELGNIGRSFPKALAEPP